MRRLLAVLVAALLLMQVSLARAARHQPVQPARINATTTTATVPTTATCTTPPAATPLPDGNRPGMDVRIPSQASPRV